MDMIEMILQANIAVVFKHSNRCPISARAFREFERFSEDYKGKAKLFLVDVIGKREISREIETRTGVAHQSPQMMIINGGVVEWNASHGSITRRKIEETIGDR